MVESLYVFPETHTLRDGLVTISAAVERRGQERKTLWYRVPEEFAYAVTPSSDPFVLSTLFKAMREHAELVIHGEVSPALLRNLEEFQHVWAMWKPEVYQPIEIRADVEREQAPAPSNAAITAYSTGVDGSFTAWRHHTGLSGRRTRNLRAGMLVHGFDIGLEQPEIYAQTLARARAMLSSLGMETVPLATNLRRFAIDWFDALGAGLASCLVLLQNGWNSGLIASSYPYDHLHIPYGSLPLTEWMLSTGTFEIVHDSADVYRVDKVRALADWAAARENLRVCFLGNRRDNCCRCRKCLRTILEFRAVGAGLPECFAHDANIWQILTVASAADEIVFIQETCTRLRASGTKGAWVRAMYLSLLICRARYAARAWLTGKH